MMLSRASSSESFDDDGSMPSAAIERIFAARAFADVIEMREAPPIDKSFRVPANR